MTKALENAIKSKGEELDIQSVKEDFNRCVTSNVRKAFETRYDIGKRILTSDLTNGVYNDASVDRRFVNFVGKNLRRKLAELQGSAVDIDFEVTTILNKDSEVISSALELEVAKAIKDFKLFKSIQNVIIYPLFYGDGWIYQGWDGLSVTDGYESGIPVQDVIDPINIFLPDNIKLADKSDLKYLYHRRIQSFEDFKNYVELIGNKKLLGIINSEKGREFIIKSNVDNVNVSETTDEVAVITLHKRIELVLDLIGVVDNNNNNITYFSLEEYEAWKSGEYEKHKDKISPEGFEELLYKNEDYTALPENVVFTKPIRRKISGWVEFDFINGFDEFIDIRYVGENRRYLSISALHNTDSSYATSLAYDMAEILDLHSIITTMQVIKLLKHHKLKVWFIEEGIKNFDEFKNKYEDLETNLEIDEGWAMKHQGQVPFGYMSLPQINTFEMQLKQELEINISDMSNSPKVSRGIPDYKNQSGSAIRSLLSSVKQGDKTLVEGLSNLINDMINIVKNDVAKFKNYPHVVNLYDINDNVPIWVNKDDDPIDYEQIGRKITSVSDVHENNDEVIAMQKMEASQLRSQGALSLLDFLRMYGVKNPLRKYESILKERGVLQLQEAIDKHPELQQQILQFISQSESKNNPNNIQGVENG